jgi:hypothetical protein
MNLTAPVRRINCRGQFRGPGCVSLTQRLAKCYTGAVHDVLRIMGHDNVVLSPEIKAIAPGTRLVGPAWTVSGHIERDTELGARGASANSQRRRSKAVIASARRATLAAIRRSDSAV